MASKQEWKEMIKDSYEMEFPNLIEREINVPLEKPIRRAITIIGPRRAGKTYFMFSLMKNLLNKYERENVLYMNFEKAGLLPLDSKDLVLMKEAFFEMNPNVKKKDTWFFLDEIQNVKNWEIFVRTCLDESINVFISGSSSRMLSKEIATSMRGRTLSYEILPFSFKEYLFSKGINLENVLSSTEKSKIINLFNKYLYDGGYPETVFYTEEKERILTDIFDTALYKDVIERENIRNTDVVKRLLKALINSKEFSTNKFYNYLKSSGLKVSKDSIYNYLSYFEDAFIVFLLRKFDLSYKKESQTLPKVYFIDNGILSINNIDDGGRLLENLVFLELVRRGKKVFYYKDNNLEEVDFVVREGKKVKELIQVSFDINHFATKERELKSLVKASKEYGCKKLILITMSNESQETFKDKKIKIVPAWKWFLEKDL